ncbi:hypothetical protein U1Q18_040885 [Sarracenia purpurea var. burkii]
MMNNKVTKKPNLKGSPGFQKKGKGGNEFNHFHALSFHEVEDYGISFPSLPRVSKAQIKEGRFEVISCEHSGVTTSTVDHVEEGRRLERLTVMALNRAKKGCSKLTQEEVDHLESWLARYRASNDQSVFVAPAVVRDKRENAQMTDKMSLSESKEELASGVESSVSLADAVGEGCDRSSPFPNEDEGESKNVGKEESDDHGGLPLWRFFEYESHEKQ